MLQNIFSCSQYVMEPHIEHKGQRGRGREERSSRLTSDGSQHSGAGGTHHHECTCTWKDMTDSRKPESNNVRIMILGLDTRKHALRVRLCGMQPVSRRFVEICHHQFCAFGNSNLGFVSPAQLAQQAASRNPWSSIPANPYLREYKLAEFPAVWCVLCGQELDRQEVIGVFGQRVATRNKFKGSISLRKLGDAFLMPATKFLLVCRRPRAACKTPARNSTTSASSRVDMAVNHQAANTVSAP